MSDKEQHLRQVEKVAASSVLHGSESLCKLLRYLALVVGILVVALIAIPFFLSPNQFRPTIEEKLSAKLCSVEPAKLMKSEE